MSHGLVATGLVVFACVGPVRAQTPADAINPDRPGASDSPTTVGAGRLQLEVGGSALWDGDDPGLYTLPVTLRYGVGQTTELRLESDTVSIQDGEHGLGDVTAGAKWTFHRGNPTLGVMAHLELPTGSRAFRQDGVTPDLDLLASAEMGERWNVEANVAVAAARDGASDSRFAQWIYAATVGAALTPKWQAFGELASLGPDRRGGPRQSLADAGLAYALRNDLVLDVDVIVGLSSAAPDWGATGGFSVRF